MNFWAIIYFLRIKPLFIVSCVLSFFPGYIFGTRSGVFSIFFKNFFFKVQHKQLQWAVLASARIAESEGITRQHRKQGHPLSVPERGST